MKFSIKQLWRRCVFGRWKRTDCMRNFLSEYGVRNSRRSNHSWLHRFFRMPEYQDACNPRDCEKISSENLWGLDVIIKTKKHSYADNYAKQNGIKVEYNGTAKPENTVHVWDSKYTTEEEATCTSEGKQSIRCLQLLIPTMGK